MWASRVLLMVREGNVLSVDGEEVPVSVETICVHADTPGAVEMIRAIRQTSKGKGWSERATSPPERASGNHRITMFSTAAVPSLIVSTRGPSSDRDCL